MESSLLPRTRKSTDQTLARNADILGGYALDVARYPKWTHDEELRECERLTAACLVSDVAAIRRIHERFVRANLRIVILIANRYVPALPLQDLVQEGNLGLLDAVRKFDPTRGNRFCTYAGWWITHHIRRAIDDTRSTIRIPIYACEKRRAAARVRDRFESALGRGPDDKELAAELDMTPRALRDATSGTNGQTISLDARISSADGDRGEAFVDLMMATTPDPLDALLEKERATDARRRIRTLPPRERAIILQRFSDEPPTLKEIGKTYGKGVCRERVRQVERDAIQRLQRCARVEAR